MGRYGFHGTTVQPGVAGHGSPFDIHNTLVSVGHDVEAGVESAVPSGSVDFALTFPPHAGLGDGPDPSEVPIESSAVRYREKPADSPTRVDHKMLWWPGQSSDRQRARVLADLKARRSAPPPWGPLVVS